MVRRPRAIGLNEQARIFRSQRPAVTVPINALASREAISFERVFHVDPSRARRRSVRRAERMSA